MKEDEIYERLIAKEIGVRFSNYDSLRVFCGFLTSKGIHHKNPILYYWEKYKEKLCVTISESGGFKCGTYGFYEKEGREIYLYNKNPYIVELTDDCIV